ncbi:hypothetical protein SSS_04100 [Sarcoptes scabiei]|uniref:Motile sperm domain-containing protein 1 n=1 Tax=Sarcoptes scabiei TaxID=52283 RepID=A0A834R4T3_SARSC|nr:hypothetical protein SSS_04100 [Sarcoptes scabiei]
MNLLVFVHPTEIEFTNNNEPQIVSIYNPYDFTIKFSFKSTKPNAFILSSAEGEILSRHTLDIIINLYDKNIDEAKLRISIYSTSNKKKMGEKTIRLICKQNESSDITKSSSSSSSKYYQQNQNLDDSTSSSSTATLLYNDVGSEFVKTHQYRDKSPNQFLIYSALIISVIILMLPYEQGGSHLNYFQVSTNFKLVAAYILGIVTVILIRN